MTRRVGIKGITAVELMMAACIGAVLMIGASVIATRAHMVILQSRQRQDINDQGRVAMDTMTQFLQKGLVQTVYRCSCNIPAAAYATWPSCITGPCNVPANNTVLPFTRIEFQTNGENKQYSFYSTSQRTLEMDSYINQTLSAHTVLATHLDSIEFLPNSAQDPAVESIGLHIGDYDDPNHPFVLVISKEIHMISSS